MPEAEPLVAPFRARFDPSGSRGVPAHITLLFPFVPAGNLTDPILSALRARFEIAVQFEYRLARTDRFLEVVYLVPDPAGPFRDLVRQLSSDWPDRPPYGGEIAVNDILPHLTVAHSTDPAELDRIDAELSAGLPIECAATEAWLMTEEDDGGWHRHSVFDFGGAAGRA